MVTYCFYLGIHLLAQIRLPEGTGFQAARQEMVARVQKFPTVHAERGGVDLLCHQIKWADIKVYRPLPE